MTPNPERKRGRSSRRGWVEFQHGWQLPNPSKLLESKAKMKESACVLDESERRLVEAQVAETCGKRGWTLHAVNCRSNHIHVVISAADTDPRKIQRDLKAWCTRRLKEASSSGRDSWWAERGSLRWIFSEGSLATVVGYVMEAQDRKDRDQS